MTSDAATADRAAVARSATTRATTDEERDEIRLNNRGGFVFLLVHGVTWTLAGALSLVLPIEQAALLYLFQGVVAFPASLAIERALGFRLIGSENSLTTLFVMIATIQMLALPAAIIVFSLEPLLLPAAFAATAGGHFLPYAWLHRTQAYAVLAAVTALAPFGVALVAGRTTSFHGTGFIVGATLLIAGIVIRWQVGREVAGRAQPGTAGG